LITRYLPDGPGPQAPSAVWDRVWARDHYSRPSLRAKRAKRKIRAVAEGGFFVPPPARVLEIGCGSCAVSLQLARMLPDCEKIVACDWSPVALTLALTEIRNAGSNVRLCQSDATRLPFRDNLFDTVIAFGLLEHVVDAATIITEIHRVLVPGGTVYLVTSNRHSLVHGIRRLRETVAMWPYGFQHDHTMESLLDLLRQRLSVIHSAIIQTDFDLPVCALFDRLVHNLLPFWGRYILAIARKDNTGAGHRFP
jgi:ubiquinone/menaquinone biosynthesis C-methylase UbiE